MKVAIAQINTSVGNFGKNKQKIQDFYSISCKKNVDIVIFPELTITGYPPKDLLLNNSFIDESEKIFNEIVPTINYPSAVIGFVQKNKKTGKPFHNAAAFIIGRKTKQIAHKILIPSYDVFDEDRYFEPGKTISLFDFLNYKIAISICEDIWGDKDYLRTYKYPRNPAEEQIKKGAQILINISASPYGINKQEVRYKILSDIAKKHKVFIIYCNLVGATDELIFDGYSMAINTDGKLIAKCKAFEEDIAIFNLDNGLVIKFNEKEIDDMENLYKALILGIREYMSKCGFKSAVIGLSGGIDSALVACLAAAAIGPENVYCVSMPSRFTSKESIKDAQTLAQNLSTNFSIINIDNIFQSYLNTISNHIPFTPEDITTQNIQARIRGNVLMAFSNKFNRLVLSTGNKSELAVGYCTLYGDMTGGLSVLADVPKTLVYKLAYYVNRDKEIIPINIIKKPPSAELKPNQKDQDDLPPYEFLDQILKLYIEEEKTIKDITAILNNNKLVREIISKIELNEFKRRQAPPALKVSPRAFGIGRRIPITQQFIKHMMNKNNTK